MKKEIEKLAKEFVREKYQVKSGRLTNSEISEVKDLVEFANIILNNLK